MKQYGFSVWLKAITLICAVLGLCLCFLLAPMLLDDLAANHTELKNMFYPGIIFVWITAIPFFAALVEVWLICEEIGRDNSFCVKNALRLRTLSGLGILECVFYTVATVFLLVKGVNLPWLFLLFLFIIFVGVSAAVGAAALSHLVRKAADLKQDSELTI